MNPAVWAFLGSVVTALAMWLGAKYTARASKEASQYSSTVVGAPEGIATGYAQLTDDLWENIRDLRGRLDLLEGDMILVKRRYRAAVSYIRQLLSWIAIHVPEHQPPEPPEDIDLK